MDIHLNIYLNIQRHFKCPEYLFKYSFEYLFKYSFECLFKYSFECLLSF